MIHHMILILRLYIIYNTNWVYYADTAGINC